MAYQLPDGRWFEPGVGEVPGPVAPGASAENPQMNYFSSISSIGGYDGPEDFMEALRNNNKGIPHSAEMATKYLGDLKNAVQTGQLSLVDYQGALEALAEPLTQQFNSYTQQGQSAANLTKSVATPLYKYFDFKAGETDVQGIKLGFTKQEYAKLPESVLPTKEQVTQGLFNETLAPIRRYRPGTPSNVGTGTTGNQTVTLPGDPLGNTVVTDPRQRQIEEEALRQEEQSRLMAEQSKATREAQLTELADLLTKRSQEVFNLEKPGMYEDLNTRGLLRSSALGDRLSTRAQELERENQNALAQIKLGYGEQNLTDIQNILANKQGFQTAGLQARLGLEDAEAQKQLAMTLAELSKPKQPSGKTSGEKWAQGISVGADAAGTIIKAAKTL